ncbi:type II toxin-antitoxin system CcdA family antitoxin [Rhizobium sp. 0TCS1.26]|uniref:type II toxin-antitoxin system CcdA family antitoxin n=1 Tax=Rhizobium sp. 0TCS1.26 TaxID=3142623 RepID=UPI003D2879DA
MSVNAIKSVELPLSEALLAEARDLKLDVAGAAEDGIMRAVKAEKERLWRLENAEAIQAANDYVEKYGLPLAKFRLF